MYTVVIIPKPTGAGPWQTAINNAVPAGREIVAIAVDGNNVIIVFR